MIPTPPRELQGVAEPEQPALLHVGASPEVPPAPAVTTALAEICGTQQGTDLASVLQG